MENRLDTTAPAATPTGRAEALKTEDKMKTATRRAEAQLKAQILALDCMVIALVTVLKRQTPGAAAGMAAGIDSALSRCIGPTAAKARKIVAQRIGHPSRRTGRF